MNQRGFVLGGNLLLVTGVAGALLLAALGVTSYMLLDAREALGAYQARAAQLEADVEAQARELADERRDRARIDKLLAATQATAEANRRRVASADARYQRAKREVESARDWAAARQPDAAIERLCDDEPGSDPSGAGAGAASYCVARRNPAAVAAGPDQR